MPTPFIQRQIDGLLEQASEALKRFDWTVVRQSAEAVLGFDPENADAQALLKVAGGHVPPSQFTAESAEDAKKQNLTSATPASSAVNSPSSFANGR